MLLDHGHPDAMLYPLGMVADEAALVIEREDRRTATLGVVMQGAVGSIKSKERGDIFRQLITSLNGA